MSQRVFVWLVHSQRVSPTIILPCRMIRRATEMERGHQMLGLRHLIRKLMLTTQKHLIQRLRVLLKIELGHQMLVLGHLVRKAMLTTQLNLIQMLRVLLRLPR